MYIFQIYLSYRYIIREHILREYVRKPYIFISKCFLEFLKADVISIRNSKMLHYFNNLFIYFLKKKFYYQKVWKLLVWNWKNNIEDVLNTLKYQTYDKLYFFWSYIAFRSMHLSNNSMIVFFVYIYFFQYFLRHVLTL